VGHPLREVTCEGLLGDAIVSGSMITVKDARPRDDEKEVYLAPSLITRSCRRSKLRTENVGVRKFETGELVVGNCEEAVGEEAQIIKYDHNLGQWLVELGGVELYLRPDQLQSKFIAGGRGFETLLFGDHCKVKKEAFHTIQSKAGLFTLWRKSFSTQNPPLICSKVSFRNSMMIFLFMGERESGGYRIEVSEVKETKLNILVYYNMKLPQVDEKILPKKTSPYLVVRVARPAKPIKYIYRAN